MKNTLPIAMLLCACLAANAQSFNYKPLQAQGEIPLDFSARYSEKVEIEAKKLDSLKGKELKNELSYHAYNEFVVDAYLTSGKVIYGDELTAYLNDVLDVVLSEDKDLRDEMRVYAVKDADFNAHTTSKGIIFVNMGLLAQLATEAQLAYVLAHEVVHYANNHVRKNYDFKKTTSKNSNAYDYDVDKLAKTYYDYSKENELEADKQGYQSYFARTNYSTLAPFELMDIMLYSYLPFDEIEFDVAIFNTETFGLASEDMREFAAKEISAREDVSDIMSTHPNIKARTEAIKEFLDLKKEGSDFLVSQTRFNALREQARFESLDDYLITASYDKAIYQAFLLLQTYPTDDYLKRAIVYAVYGSAVYKNRNKLPSTVKNMDEVEGELSRIRYIIHNIENENLNTMAVAMSYEYYRNHQDDKLAKRMYEDAVWELARYHKKKLKDYELMPSFTETDSTAEEEIELNTTGKVKRLKKRKVNGAIYQMKYAFSTYLADSAFTSSFTRLVIEAEDTYDETEENIGGKGVTNVMVVTPESYTLQVKGSAINFKKSEQGEIAFVEAIKSSSKNLGVEMQLFDYKYVTKVDADRFNELQTLQLWYDEHLNHEKIGIVHYMFSRVDPICDKYGSDHLMYTGILNLSNKGANKNSGLGSRVYAGYLKLGLSIAFLPAAPFIFGVGFVPSYSSYQFVRVVNLRSDKMVLTKSYEFDQYRSTAIQNTLIYNQIDELRSEPKYK